MGDERGRFITLEGVDGAGKSTFAPAVAARIRSHGFEVVETREPGGTPLGEALREILLARESLEIGPDAETLLMFAARSQHVRAVVAPALERGDWVVCDRFTDATYAYQGGGRGVAAARIAELEQWVQGDLRPDLTLLFDVPVALGRERGRGRSGAPDRFEREELGFRDTVRDAYLTRQRRDPARLRLVDAREPVDRVRTAVNHEIERFVAAC